VCGKDRVLANQKAKAFTLSLLEIRRLGPQPRGVHQRPIMCLTGKRGTFAASNPNDRSDYFAVKRNVDTDAIRDP